MKCPACNRQMMRVKHEESETETIDTFACTNKQCPRFSGTDLNNPKYPQEERKAK
jgi:hypothetical protein